MHTKLEVDVHGHWSDRPPVYRIYVDNEMLIERTFGWPSYQNFITENMYCNLDTGVHTLKLENLDSNSRFEISNFTVDKNLVNKNLLRIQDSTIEWRFIVDNVLQSTQNYFEPAVVLDEALDLLSLDKVRVPPEKPKGVSQPKKYEPYIPLVQRARQLNAKK